MLSITIKSKSLEFYAEIKDRVCVLVGDSGIGKTTMYNILRRRKQPPDTEVSIVIDGQEIDSNSIFMMNDAAGFINLHRSANTHLKYMKLLFLVDDDTSEQSEEARYLLSTTVNAHFIFITREEKIYNVNYDIRSIYTLELSENGTKHITKRLLDEFGHRSYPDELRFKDTLIVSEDSKAGFQFYSKLCKLEVVPISDSRGNISGKDSLVRMLERFDLRNKTVVLFMNWCSFGTNFNKLLNLKRRCGENTDFIFNENILSFEHLLLTTNLLKSRLNDKPLDSITVDRTMSYEKQFQHILEAVTKETEFYMTHHSNLPICYYAPCCSKLKNGDYCRYALNGEKLAVLFKGTVFEDILKFRRM